MPALLFLAVVLVFLPSLRNGFIDYDDAPFVTANPQVQSGLNWSSLACAFCRPVAANWHPLTTLSHMADCQIYGLNPWGHHLTNVLLHAASTVLVFLVFRRMTGAVWRSAVLAALFGLHPLRVESVVWISERKDVLGGLFFMLTLWAYVRYAEGRPQASVHGLQSTVHGRLRAPISYLPSSSFFFYSLTLVFFALGLMSKPMLVTLPFVLLLLDYWPFGRIAGAANGGRARGWIATWAKLVWEKAPFFGLAAAVGAVAFVVQAGAGNVRTTGQFLLSARAQNALVSYCRYLGKLFWPADLSPFYPYPATGWGMAAVVLSGLLLVGISALVILLGRQRGYLATGWFWFVGTLVPVIGLVQVGNQSMADHYTYIPGIGVLLMLVWGGYELATRWRCPAVAGPGLAGAASLVCVILTERQIGYWRDNETLWQHAMAATGANSLATYNLGVAWFNQGLSLAAQGAYDQAIPYYEKAIRLSPARDDAHSALGYALLRKGMIAGAIREYEESLHLNSRDPETHNNLANALLKQGRLDEAVPHLTQALRLRPGYPEAHDNLGAVLAARGRFAEAAAQFREVVRLNPAYPGPQVKLERVVAAQERLEKAAEPFRQALQSNAGDARAHSGLGRVLIEAGQVDEAVEHCAEAVRLDPGRAENQYQLGAALARKGDGEKAARQFDLALERDPGFAPAHYALAICRQQQGRAPDALKHWREAARLAPGWPDPLNNLAWALATDSHAELRDGPEAVKLASRAAELSGTNSVGILDTLAAAYAEAGRFAEACSVARQAQVMAETQGLGGLAEKIGLRLTLYGSRQPYRDEPGAR